jgi:O-acetyl-ADP-ribose deacetylase (regulator of RNase III)
MSGGVNGEILRRGGEAIQKELHEHLQAEGNRAVDPGAVVVTSPGPLNAKHLLHVVAIDPFYDSSVGLVCDAIGRALCMARELGALTVAMPALATGYGHLTIEEFAKGLSQALQTDWRPIRQVTVVVREAEYEVILRKMLIEDQPIRAEKNSADS